MNRGECFTPNITASQWLIPLLRGVWNYSENKKGSGTNARNIIKSKAITVNGYSITLDEVIDYPVLSVVIYPNSTKRKITLF